MRTPRSALATALLATLAAAASAGMWPWQRKLEFARALNTRQYYDISDRVIDRLERNESIIGIERAFLYRELGEYYADLAQMAAAEKKDLSLFIAQLDKARAAFQKFLDHKSIKNNPRYAAERFDISLRLSRIQLAVAEGHARELDRDKTTKAQKEEHKKRAVAIFKAAIEAFNQAVAEKQKQLKKVEKLAPPANASSKLRDKFRERRQEAREQLFRVRLERDISRVRFAKLLKKIGQPVQQWRAQLDAAEKDYRQLLLDFTGTLGATQANLELARCLIEKGAKHDKEALERLEEVWAKRGSYTQYKSVPCEAAELRARILLRQKKSQETINTVDALLRFASEGVWNPEQKTLAGVVETLEALPASDPVSYDQRAGANAFLMEAEAYAQMGAAAEKAKKKRGQIRRLYGAAYDIALGVLEVRQYLDPKYSPLLEKWRIKANRPVAPAVVRQRYLDAISNRKYADAARYMRAIASRQALLPASELKPDQKRQQWVTVGQCYHAAGRDHEAAIAFLAAGRWFPTPSSEAYRAASAAVSAANAQYQKTKAPHDQKFLRWVQMQAESLNPYGKGGIYVRQAEAARKEGKFDRALDLLAKVHPEQEAYPHALYHKGRTYKAMFADLDDQAKAGPAGQRAAARMKAAFEELFDYYQAKAPALRDKNQADALDRLTSVVGAAVAMYTDFHLRPPAKDPATVLQLTNGLPQRFPGIERTPGYAIVIFSRMRAAYTQIVAAESVQAGATLLPIVEQTWKTLGTFPNFRYLDKAAAMAAQSHIALAKKAESAAEAAKDHQAKAALSKQADGLRDKAIGYYLQLVELAPRQTLRTYRYILHSLKTRDHEPKSEDWHSIVQIAPKVIEMFRKAPRAEDALTYVKAALGLAHFHLQKYREAIPILEEVDDYYEAQYQADLKPYREARRKWEEDPRGNPKPGRAPRRAAGQPEVMETLALCYLRAEAKDKYDRAERTFVTLTRLYQRKPSKYWEVFYYLCETYRRRGKFEDAVKQIERAWLRDASLGGKASDFHDLVAQVQRDVARLKDAQRKAILEPLLKRLFDNLAKKR